MARFEEVGLSYFVIGVMFYGSGLIDWSDAGLATYFFSSPGSAAVDAGAIAGLNSTGGAIESAATAVVGPILAIWNLLTSIIGFIAWPAGVLNGAGAPWEVTVLLGGSLVVAFFFGIINVVVRAT